MKTKAIWAVLVAFGFTNSVLAIDSDALKREPIVFQESMVRGETAETFIDLDGLKQAIRRKRNLNTRDSGGETLMSYAVADGNVTAIRMLIDAGASTRLRFTDLESKQSTVAHRAAESSCHQCLGLLLSTDKWLLHATDSNGETAIFRAVRGAQSDQAFLLWALGADANHKNKNGKTIFDIAEKSGEKMLSTLKKMQSRE